LEGIREKAEKLIKKQYSLLYKDDHPALRKHGVDMLFDEDDLKPYESYLAAFFESQLKQVLTPISVGPTHPFPTLVSGAIYLAVELKPAEDRPKSIETSALSFVEIPRNVFGRFLKVGEDDIYVPIEYVVKKYLTSYNGSKSFRVAFARDPRRGFTIDIDSIWICFRDRSHRHRITSDPYEVEYEKDNSQSILKTLVEMKELTAADLFPPRGISTSTTSGRSTRLLPSRN
jgi:polyphosphate kinase